MRDERRRSVSNLSVSSALHWCQVSARGNTHGSGCCTSTGDGEASGAGAREAERVGWPSMSQSAAGPAPAVLPTAFAVGCVSPAFRCSATPPLPRWSFDCCVSSVRTPWHRSAPRRSSVWTDRRSQRGSCHFLCCAIISVFPSGFRSTVCSSSLLSPCLVSSRQLQ